MKRLTKLLPEIIIISITILIALWYIYRTHTDPNAHPRGWRY